MIYQSKRGHKNVGYFWPSFLMNFMNWLTWHNKIPNGLKNIANCKYLVYLPNPNLKQVPLHSPPLSAPKTFTHADKTVTWDQAHYPSRKVRDRPSALPPPLPRHPPQGKKKQGEEDQWRWSNDLWNGGCPVCHLIFFSTNPHWRWDYGFFPWLLKCTRGHW
jgi:hypothetical protein